MNSEKTTVINDLRQNLLKWEGYKAPLTGTRNLLGLGPVEAVFPNGVFPVGSVHELVCANREQAAVSGGFVTGVLSLLMQEGGICVWIGRTWRFAPALKSFNILPHRVIFIRLRKDEDALWVMEEALKCPGLAAVVCETKKLDFRQSQRLQRSVEQSRVTGFVLRNAANKLNSTACAARWQIRAVASTDMGTLPGIGFLRWQIDLLKVRNGQEGRWVMEWRDDHFVPVELVLDQEERQVG